MAYFLNSLKDKASQFAEKMLIQQRPPYQESNDEEVLDIIVDDDADAWTSNPSNIGTVKSTPEPAQTDFFSQFLPITASSIIN
jgi:hypothetical protein